MRLRKSCFVPYTLLLVSQGPFNKTGAFLPFVPSFVLDHLEKAGISGKKKERDAGKGRTMKKAKVVPEQQTKRSEEKELWKVLVEEWSFHEDLARKFDQNGVAKVLIQLEKEGFKISEGDPLLIAVVDHNNPDSVGYANAGNYGVTAGDPGHLAWPGGVAPAVGAPLPPGVSTAPPNALAAFLREMPDVVDKSGGLRGLVFYVPNMGRLHEMSPRFGASQQFRRVGPTMAGALGIPVQPPLVDFYTLDQMRAAPYIYPNFNQSW